MPCFASGQKLEISLNAARRFFLSIRRTTSWSTCCTRPTSRRWLTASRQIRSPHSLISRYIIQLGLYTLLAVLAFWSSHPVDVAPSSVPHQIHLPLSCLCARSTLRNPAKAVANAPGRPLEQMALHYLRPCISNLIFGADVCKSGEGCDAALIATVRKARTSLTAPPSFATNGKPSSSARAELA